MGKGSWYLDEDWGELGFDCAFLFPVCYYLLTYSTFTRADECTGHI